MHHTLTHIAQHLWLYACATVLLPVCVCVCVRASEWMSVSKKMSVWLKAIHWSTVICFGTIYNLCIYFWCLIFVFFSHCLSMWISVLHYTDGFLCVRLWARVCLLFFLFSHLFRIWIYFQASAHLFRLIMTTMTIMILTRTEIAYNITLLRSSFLCWAIANGAFFFFLFLHRVSRTKPYFICFSTSFSFILLCAQHGHRFNCVIQKARFSKNLSFKKPYTPISLRAFLMRRFIIF